MHALIRPVDERDASRIAGLCRELGYVASDSEIGERLRVLAGVESNITFVAENERGDVVGWIQAQTSWVLESGFRAEITGLVVSGAARREGVGRQLAASVETWARSKGAPAIVVRSNIKRGESHPFYAALGYAETKIQRVYRKSLER